MEERERQNGLLAVERDESREVRVARNRLI